MTKDSLARKLVAAETVDPDRHKAYQESVQRLILDRLHPVIRVTLVGVSGIVGISAAKLMLRATSAEISSWSTLTVIVAILGVGSAALSIGLLLLAIRGSYHRYRHGVFGATVSAIVLLVVGLLCLLGTHDSSLQVQNWINFTGTAFVFSALVMVTMTQLSRRRLLRRIRNLEDQLRNETETKHGNEE